MAIPKVVVLKPREPTADDDLPLETGQLIITAQQSSLLNATKLRHGFSHSYSFFFALDFNLLEFQFISKTIQLLTSRLKAVLQI